MFAALAPGKSTPLSLPFAAFRSLLTQDAQTKQTSGGAPQQASSRAPVASSKQIANALVRSMLAVPADLQPFPVANEAPISLESPKIPNATSVVPGDSEPDPDTESTTAHVVSNFTSETLSSATSLEPGQSEPAGTIPLPVPAGSSSSATRSASASIASHPALDREVKPMFAWRPVQTSDADEGLKDPQAAPPDSYRTNSTPWNTISTTRCSLPEPGNVEAYSSSGPSQPKNLPGASSSSLPFSPLGRTEEPDPPITSSMNSADRGSGQNPSAIPGTSLQSKNGLHSDTGVTNSETRRSLRGTLENAYPAQRAKHAPDSPELAQPPAESSAPPTGLVPLESGGEKPPGNHMSAKSIRIREGRSQPASPATTNSAASFDSGGIPVSAVANSNQPASNSMPSTADNPVSTSAVAKAGASQENSTAIQTTSTSMPALYEPGVDEPLSFIANIVPAEDGRSDARVDRVAPASIKTSTITENRPETRIAPEPPVQSGPNQSNSNVPDSSFSTHSYSNHETQNAMNAAPTEGAVQAETGAEGTGRRDIVPARTDEPIPAAIAPQPGAGNNPPKPVQDITVRLAQPAAPPVDLRITQRAGEIHVSVRTPDVELQSSLRQDLGTLANSLERAGFHAETFVPRTSATGAMSPQRDPRQDADRGFSGRGGSQDQPAGQQKRERRTQSWLDEMEQSR